MVVLLLVAVPQVTEVPAAWVNAAVLLVPTGVAVGRVALSALRPELVVNRTLVIAVLSRRRRRGLPRAGGLGRCPGRYVGRCGAVRGRLRGGTGVPPGPASASSARWTGSSTAAGVTPMRCCVTWIAGCARPRTLRARWRRRAKLIRHGLRLPGTRIVVPTPGAPDFEVVSGAIAAPGERDRRWSSTASRSACSRSRPVPGRAAGDADHRVLAALAGPGLLGGVRAADLRRPRGVHRRLLGAREEERRRLRRDLHDGLGPQLAGVVMGLDVVRSTLRRGQTARAVELLRDGHDQARTAVEDVRRLVSGLRPPVLDDLGLVGALRSTGPARIEGGPTISGAGAGGLDELPAAVEVAAYRIAPEALTNAVRHAGASR